MKPQKMQMQLSFNGDVKIVKQNGNSIIVEFETDPRDLWNEQINFWIEPNITPERKSLSGVIRVTRKNKLEVKKFT